MPGFKRRISWQKDDPTMDIQSVISMDQILMIQKQVEKVYVDDNVLMYITRIIRKPD